MEKAPAVVNGGMCSVYPHVDEELIDFLERCKLNDSKVGMCSRCNGVYDEDDAK